MLLILSGGFNETIYFELHLIFVWSFASFFISLLFSFFSILCLNFLIFLSLMFDFISIIDLHQVSSLNAI